MKKGFYGEEGQGTRHMGVLYHRGGSGRSDRA